MVDDTSGTTWGTNGFYLPMNDDDYIGKDFSGNENHFRGDVTTTASQARWFCTTSYNTRQSNWCYSHS